MRYEVSTSLDGFVADAGSAYCTERKDRILDRIRFCRLGQSDSGFPDRTTGERGVQRCRPPGRGGVSMVYIPATAMEN